MNYSTTAPFPTNGVSMPATRSAFVYASQAPQRITDETSFMPTRNGHHPSLPVAFASRDDRPQNGIWLMHQRQQQMMQLQHEEQLLVLQLEQQQQNHQQQQELQEQQQELYEQQQLLQEQQQLLQQQHQKIQLQLQEWTTPHRTDAVSVSEMCLPFLSATSPLATPSPTYVSGTSASASYPASNLDTSPCSLPIQRRVLINRTADDVSDVMNNYDGDVPMKRTNMSNLDRVATRDHPVQPRNVHYEVVEMPLSPAAATRYAAFSSSSSSSSPSLAQPTTRVLRGTPMMVAPSYNNRGNRLLACAPSHEHLEYIPTAGMDATTPRTMQVSTFHQQQQQHSRPWPTTGNTTATFSTTTVLENPQRITLPSSGVHPSFALPLARDSSSNSGRVGGCDKDNRGEGGKSNIPSTQQQRFCLVPRENHNMAILPMTINHNNNHHHHPPMHLSGNDLPPPALYRPSQNNNNDDFSVIQHHGPILRVQRQTCGRGGGTTTTTARAAANHDDETVLQGNSDTVTTTTTTRILLPTTTKCTTVMSSSVIMPMQQMVGPERKNNAETTCCDDGEATVVVTSTSATKKPGFEMAGSSTCMRRRNRSCLIRDPPPPPRRSRSAFNFFFRHQRKLILLRQQQQQQRLVVPQPPPPRPPSSSSSSSSQNPLPKHLEEWKELDSQNNDDDDNGGGGDGMSFACMAQVIGQKWKAMDAPQRAPYKALEEHDQKRYRQEKIVYLKQQHAICQEAYQELMNEVSMSMTKS